MPIAENDPTTLPVSSSDRSRSFTTTGVTAESVADGTKNAAVVRNTISIGPAARIAGPRKSTICGASTTNTPETAISGPMSGPGAVRSAAAPPAHAPIAMPASTTPMMPVNVSSETPM